MFSAEQTEIKKICYSGIRYGLTLPRPSEATFVPRPEFFVVFVLILSCFGGGFMFAFQLN
jgi:hypothetical protein